MDIMIAMRLHISPVFDLWAYISRLYEYCTTHNVNTQTVFMRNAIMLSELQ